MEKDSDESEIFPRSEYDSIRPILGALNDEVFFILSDSIESEEIKIHTIESRVKEFISLSAKIREKSIEKKEDIEDLVGARVVCLFKSDIIKIENLIHKYFKVIKREDKISDSSDSFGYMSVHYICQIPSSYKGPRYNRINNIKFEIQVRTICMHAWAAISHYLDYKSEWDIPDHLKKGLNALSGLFYVADEQYERLYDARQESREKANESSGAAESSDAQINFDTVAALLERKYSDRQKSTADHISELVRELTESGYETISQVEKDLDSAKRILEKNETETKRAQNIRRKLFYTQGGAVRVSLRNVNEKYKKAMDKLIAEKRGRARPATRRNPTSKL